MATKTWGDLLNEVRRAIATEDWDRGERAVEWLRREAEHQADPETLASAAFYAGMFFDAKGELAEAEASFQEAVSWDERAHGPEHFAVADALRSVAIVQNRRGNVTGAASTSRRSADIYARLGRAADAAECLCAAGQRLSQAGQLDTAYDAFADALTALEGTSDLPARTQRVHALVGQAECMRRSKEFVVAFGHAADATRQGEAPTSPALLLALGNAWMTIAFMARHALRDEPLAVLAYALARDLSSDHAVQKRAASEIASSPLAALGRDPIDGYVISSVGRGGEIQLLHPSHGMRMARHEGAPAAPAYQAGDRVSVRRDRDTYVVTGRADA